MSKDLTRLLGIEFERRLLVMDPSFETINKLDTETIYSFLNEYLYKYVLQLLSASSQPIEDRSKINPYVLSKIQGALKTNVLLTSKQGGVSGSLQYADFYLPVADYSYYLYSTLIVDKSYNGKGGELNTKLVSNADVDKLTTTTYDEDRIIRTPLITIVGTDIDEDLSEDGYDDTTCTIFRVFTDKYTAQSENVTLKVVCYKNPAPFSTLDEDACCELPDECFDDIVTGALELFINTRYKLQQPRNKNEESKKEDK